MGFFDDSRPVPRNLDNDLDDFYESRRKSIVGAIVLPLLFGPVGTLYGATLNGVILCLVSGAIVAAVILGGIAAAFSVPDPHKAAETMVTAPFIALLVLWAFSIFLGLSGALRHNRSVRSQAALWRRLITAR